MTFGQIPPDVELKIRQIVKEGQGHRKYENLVVEWKVRTKHGLRVISNPKERNAFLLLVWAEMNRGHPISQTIIDTWYADRNSLMNLNMPGADTALRDNRAMEAAGLFPKPDEEHKPVEKQVTLG